MEETMERIRRAHEGDRDERDRLILENTGLVRSIMRRFAGRGHEPEDLFQIGCIGLIKAIDRFDLTQNVRFSTYAVPMILGEIRRFLRDDGMLKVSRSLRELGIRAARERERLTDALFREPTVDEIARALEVSREELSAALEASAEVSSLSQSVGSGEQNLCLMDRIPDPCDQNERLMNRLVLEKLLEELPARDLEIMRRRYFENETQASVAEKLHISQVQVSRLEKRILRRLRGAL